MKLKAFRAGRDGRPKLIRARCKPTVGCSSLMLQQLLQQTCGNPLLAMRFLQAWVPLRGIRSLFCCIAPYRWNRRFAFPSAGDHAPARWKRDDVGRYDAKERDPKCMSHCPTAAASANW